MVGRMDGKVAVITGGASGIGRGTALRFAEEGAAVMVADLNGDRAADVASEIVEAGGTAESVVVDTSQLEAVRAMAQATMDAFGRLDACVAAAGISHADEQAGADRFDKGDMLLLDKSVETWQRVLDVNLTGVMLTGQVVAQKMIETGNGGAIVNISSVAGKTALMGSSDYCVSKAGVWMLTKCQSIEFARHKIRANAVGPGYIKTSMSAAAGGLDRWVDARIKETPMRRLGEPNDIANACLYLASDDAGFVTGEIIFPDGGLMADNR